uniref:Putative membrane protein n=1 Tax=uncultured bacterium esnapd12 TaxID=1366592 RepID=S5TUJ2_9BACT|nr:putative membrane protein [uncultured bacterium esnapd12]
MWLRSAPAFAGYATLMVCALMIFSLTGQTDINVAGEPTTVEWAVLTIMLVALPLGATIGWLVSLLRTQRARFTTATAAIAVASVCGLVSDGPSQLINIGLTVLVLLGLTASGIGSVLGWAVRLMLSHLAAVGALAVRALPVVLLTVLVFFNGNVWLMAATISRTRLWLAIGFLVAVAGSFLLTGTLERARPILRAANAPPEHAKRLAGTPFESMPDPPRADKLSIGERLNIVFVLAASQLVQILMVALVTAAVFFALGLILLSPELLAVWTRNGSSDGTLLFMKLPVPQALIQMALFLGALTFMYISARAVGDGEYRSKFLDPLIDDLQGMLIARNRYRGKTNVPAAPDMSGAAPTERVRSPGLRARS